MTGTAETKPKKPRKAPSKRGAPPEDATAVNWEDRARELEQELAQERAESTKALNDVVELYGAMLKLMESAIAKRKQPAAADKPKPPPITVGVGGIEPEPIVLTAASTGIDWRAISMLPPFQIFAQEVMKATHETGIVIEDYAQFAMQFIQHASQTVSEQELLDNYCRWHEASGKWPKETPFGEEKV